MRKNFLYVNTFLLLIIIILYFILNIKLSGDLKSSFVNLQNYYQEEQINIWEASFEEVTISSLKSFDIRNIYFGFDYPTNNLKLKLSLRIDNINIAVSDFSVKEVKVRVNNIRLNHINPGTIKNANWISENYPYVGLDNGNLEFAFAVNNPQDIKKTIESNLKEFIKLFDVGSTAIKFNFSGRLRFNTSSPQETDLKVIQKENKYSLNADFNNFVSTTEYIKIKKFNSSLLKDYLFNAYLLDFEYHVASEVESFSRDRDKNKFPKDIYFQALSGFLLKLYFKESFINQFLELKLQSNEIYPPALKELFLNNFKLGYAYADSGVKEDEIKKILFEDRRVLLRPSNFSIKVK